MRRMITFACATNFARQARLERRVRAAEKALDSWQKPCPSHSAPSRVRVAVRGWYLDECRDLPVMRATIKRRHVRALRRTAQQIVE